jgi:LemA protein
VPESWLPGGTGRPARRVLRPLLHCPSARSCRTANLDRAREASATRWPRSARLALILLAVLGGRAVAAYRYNRLVRLRNEAETIGEYRRAAAAARRPDSNLVKVKGYAAHERGVFDEVTRARAELQQAATPGSAAVANEGLTAALGRLFAVAEAYPELQASESFLRLQEDLTDTEDKISAARRYYNATVMRFNTAVQTIPWLLLARPLGFREREFFSARRHRAARGVVRTVTLQEQIRANRFRSAIVVLGFALLLVVVAGLIGLALDLSLGALALAAAAVYGLFALLRSRSMIASFTRAHELPPGELAPLRRLVENVSIAAGLPVTPEVRIVDDTAPNAFAAGLRPETSYVGVTTGLLSTMPKRELEAVLAHEVSHIRNRDTYLMTMATVFAGAIALVADIGFRTLAYGGRSRKAGALVGVLAVVGLLLAPSPRSCRRACPAASSRRRGRARS